MPESAPQSTLWSAFACIFDYSSYAGFAHIPSQSTLGDSPVGLASFRMTAMCFFISYTPFPGESTLTKTKRPALESAGRFVLAFGLPCGDVGLTCDGAACGVAQVGEANANIVTRA